MSNQLTSMMKMQKTVLVVSILMMAGMASAAQNDLPRASQTPGDTFYFLDRFSDSLELAVAEAPVIGSPELEAKVRANHAAERLAEARKLAEKNRSEAVDKLMEDYSRQINLSVQSAREANNTELSRRLQNVSRNHVEVLQDVQQRVPEPAKKGIQNAIENSQRNQRELEVPGDSRGGRSGNKGGRGPGSGPGRPDVPGGDSGMEAPSGGPANLSQAEAGNLTEEERVERRSEELARQLEQTVENSSKPIEGRNKSTVNQTAGSGEGTGADENLSGTIENISEITGEAVEKQPFTDRP